MIEELRRVMPHMKDSDMEELAEHILGRHQNITDGKFVEISLKRQSDDRNLLGKIQTYYAKRKNNLLIL